MHYFLPPFVRSILIGAFFTVSLAALAAPPKSFFDLSAKSIDGKSTDMSTFKGKVVLVVNTASKCGYTPQYEGLQALVTKYQSKGFMVVGFPSNDFGGQEPGSADEIKKFCTLNYKITFPLMEKAPVSGAAKQPIYSWLLSAAQDKGEVKWNFEKFLINRKGEVAARFGSGIAPQSPDLVQAIEKLLNP